MENKGFFSWYTKGSSQERKTFWACFSGWTLDSFDAQMFSFLLPALMATWHIGKGEAGMLSTGALLASAAGGWIAGILSDRYGRVKILMFTVLWFTSFSVIGGFSQDFHQLLIIRICQGLGFGGEWAVGAALMSEVIRPESRGRAVGLVQSGFSVGWALASVVTVAFLAWFPQELSWRVALWFSIVPALIVVWIRRNVKEPEVFTKRMDTVTKKASFGSVFERNVLRKTLLASALVAGFQTSSYAIINWLPTLLIQVRHLESAQIVMTMMIMTGGAFIGFLVNSYLCDRIGRRPTLIMFAIAAWVFTMLYMLIPMPPLMLALMGFPVGFTVNGMFASVGPFLSELFPTEVRTTCMAFSYNVGKSVGALAVTVVGLLSEHFPLSQSIGFFCLGGYVVSIVALKFLPETRGQKLDDVGEPSQEEALPASPSPSLPETGHELNQITLR